MTWISLFLTITLLPLNVTTFVSRNKVFKKDLAASVLLHSKVVKSVSPKEKKVIMYGCSGTYIGPYTILTAGHCVDITAKTWARGPNDILGYPVRLISFDRKKDLALYEAPFKHSYVQLGDMPNRGDKILNIGSPLSFEFVPSEGLVGMTDFRILGYTAHYLITTAMANPGSSGGGAFNEKGQLVGVNTMIVGMFGWQGITLTVNINTIREFLEKDLWWYNPLDSRRAD